MQKIYRAKYIDNSFIPAITLTDNMTYTSVRYFTLSQHAPSIHTYICIRMYVCSCVCVHPRVCIYVHMRGTAIFLQSYRHLLLFIKLTRSLVPFIVRIFAVMPSHWRWSRFWNLRPPLRYR